MAGGLWGHAGSAASKKVAMLVRRALLIVLAVLVVGLALPSPELHAAPKARRAKVVKKVVKEEEDERLPPPPPPPPVPVPPSPALPRIIAGNKAFEAGQYEVAVTELSAAYAIDPKPRVLFNLASAQRRAGLYREAQANYRKYLEVDPNGELKDKAIAYIAAMDEAIAVKARTRPFYKKAWFWGTVAGVVVVAGVGVGLGLALKPSLPQTEKGIFVLNF